MIQLTCRGLPAAWINGWLAAVGATVLDTRLRLHWTTDGAPLAVLSAAVIDPVDALCGSWPDGALLSDLPIAEEWKGAGVVRRRVPVEAFVTRARAARGHPCSWTLSSTVTDLSVDENGEVAHAPFDPAGPGTIKWLHHRLMKLHEKVEPSVARVRASLAGQAIRVASHVPFLAQGASHHRDRAHAREAPLRWATWTPDRFIRWAEKNSGSSTCRPDHRRPQFAASPTAGLAAPASVSCVWPSATATPAWKRPPHGRWPSAATATAALNRSSSTDFDETSAEQFDRADPVEHDNIRGALYYQ